MRKSSEPPTRPFVTAARPPDLQWSRREPLDRRGVRSGMIAAAPTPSRGSCISAGASPLELGACFRLDRVEQLDPQAVAGHHVHTLIGAVNAASAFLVRADVDDAVGLLVPKPGAVEAQNRVEPSLGLRGQLDLDRDPLVAYQPDEVPPMPQLPAADAMC